MMQSHTFTIQQSAPHKEILTEANVLVIPGWNGSGHGHWQTLWEEQYPNFRRVEQQDWSRPPRTEWIAQIDEDVRRADSQVILVAHSLGCLAVAHWAAASQRARRICCAFLVAPPWLTDSNASPRELDDFLPMPLFRLPFPSAFVASENDPYLPIELASRLASAWDSEFVNVGRQGHINIASGHGPWPTGERLLTEFVGRVCSDKQYDGQQISPLVLRTVNDSDSPS